MQKQAKGAFFFVCRAIIGRRHALRSLLARTGGSRAVCVDSVPSRFDLHNPLNSTERMTGQPEIECAWLLVSPILQTVHREASMRRGKRHKLNSRGSGFRASEILGILEHTRRVVLLQVSSVHVIP